MAEALSRHSDYMHARYYSPVLARFVSVDPVKGEAGSSQSWNRYSYAENNPIMFVDRDGRMSDATVEYMAGYNRPTVFVGDSTPEQEAMTAACLGPSAVMAAFSVAASFPAVGPGGAFLGLSSSAVISTVEQVHSDADIGEKANNILLSTSTGTLSTVLPGKGVADTLAGAVVATAISFATNDNVDAQSTASQLGSVTNAGYAHLVSAGSSGSSGKIAVLRAALQTAMEVLKLEILETPSMQDTLADIDEE